jgi:hypothetical protein
MPRLSKHGIGLELLSNKFTDVVINTGSLQLHFLDCSAEGIPYVRFIPARYWNM